MLMILMIDEIRASRDILSPSYYFISLRGLKILNILSIFKVFKLSLPINIEIHYLRLTNNILQSRLQWQSQIRSKNF